MALTLKEIKDAKPREKLYKLTDGMGLYLAVLPSGKKVWRFDYVNIDKKRKTKTIGDNDIVHRDEARRLVLEYRERLSAGLEIEEIESSSSSFESVFKSWKERWKVNVSTKHYNKVVNGINKNCMSTLSKMEMQNIKPKDIVQALSGFEERGALENLLTVKSGLNQVFDFAVARGICEYNPVKMVSNNAFQKRRPKQQRHLKPNEIYQLNNFFNDKRFNYSLRACAKFTLLTMVRVGNSSKAKWEDIDFNNKVWIIPADEMKMKDRSDHIVPLSEQAIEILNIIKELSFDLDYVFPNYRFSTHINPENINVSLKRAKIDTTTHGMRHLSSTLLNESQLFSKDLIEAALAHIDKNQVRAAYNNAAYIESRRELMQYLADFIDKCDTKENNERALKEAGISLI